MMKHRFCFLAFPGEENQFLVHELSLPKKGQRYF